MFQPRSERSPARALFAALLFGTLGAAACAPDIAEQPAPPERVSPIFDPTTATIPLPNDAALDSSGPTQGTLPDLAQINEESAAGEFARWLTNLYGWLPEQAIEIPFNGKLNVASLEGQIKLFRVEADGALTELEQAAPLYREEGAGSRVTVVPAAPLSLGTRYAVTMTTNVRDDKGDTILAPQAIYLALNDGPIVTEDGTITLPELRNSPETAKSLEGVRDLLLPISNYYKEEGLDRKDIAVAFTWTTARNAFTVLDPTTGTLPLPNTLALESDGTFPAAGLPNLSAWRAAGSPAADFNAQIYFEQYLDSLHGWPNPANSVPIELPITGDVDPATLTEETVQLWRVSEQGPQRVEVESITVIEGSGSASARVKIVPAADLLLDTSYFAFVTREARNTAGLPLQPPAALLLAMQPHPVLDDQGQPTVSSLNPANAQAVAGVQGLLGPVMTQIEAAAGLDHTDLASAWTWFSWRDPFIVFDPAGGDIPFPNAILAASGTVSLPTAGADGLLLAILNELNTRRAFSVLGAGWATIQGELDPDTISVIPSADQKDAHSVAMALTASPFPSAPAPSLLAPEEELVLDYQPELNKLFFRFPKPLLRSRHYAADEDDRATQYAGVVTNRIKGVNGLSLKPTAPFVFLSSPAPLIDADGNSLVAQLDNGSAGQLEQLRLAYARLFTSLPLVTGDRREDVAVAFVFNTDDVARPLQEARARAMARLNADAPSSARRAATQQRVDDPGAAYNGPFAGGQARDYSNIAEIQWTAEFDSVSLYGMDRQPLPYDDITLNPVGFSVFVPKEQGDCAKPFNVTILHHGLGSWRADAAHALANELAAPGSCLATVVMDLPQHGGRTPGEASLHPEVKPATSGATFVSGDLIASKNNFAQGAIDTSALTRIIKASGLNAVVDSGAGTFSTNVGFAGISLGAAVGQLFVTIDPDVRVAALNVPPGQLSYYLSEPSSVGAGLLPILSGAGIMRGSFLFEQALSFLQWLLDPVDPAALAPYITSNTLEVLSYSPADGMYNVVGGVDSPTRVPAARVLIQMALDDQTTPNRGTIQLAETMGVSLMNTTFEAPHSFISNASSPEELAAQRCGRAQIVQWLSSGLESSSNTPTLPANLQAPACLTN